MQFWPRDCTGKFTMNIENIKFFIVLRAQLRLAIAVALSFWASTTWAGDILFVDVNNAISELAVIQQKLERDRSRGQEIETRLAVVPSYETVSLEERQRLQEINTEIQELSKRNSQHSTDANVRQIYDLGVESRILLKGDAKQDYRIADLLRELELVVNNSKYNFDRVYVSGHHVSGVMTSAGILGGEFVNGITSEHLAQIFNMAPSMQSVHSLIMLGCNTGTDEMMGDANSHWAQVLPDAVLKVGFDGNAPPKSDRLDLSILREMLSINDLVQELDRQPRTYVLDSILHRLTRVKVGNRRLGIRLDGRYFRHPSRATFERVAATGGGN